MSALDLDAAIAADLEALGAGDVEDGDFTGVDPSPLEQLIARVDALQDQLDELDAQLTSQLRELAEVLRARAGH